MYGVDQPQHGQLDITTSFNPTQIFLHGTSATIEIDGQPAPRPWGRWVFDLWPGNHTVRVWFPYMLSSRSGLAAMSVAIWPGHATLVRYEAPFIVLMAGTLQMLGTRPMGAW